MDKDKYKKLKELLAENEKWPMKYMFKCIVPNSDDSMNKVLLLLPPEGQLSFKDSDKKNYTSVTSIAMMHSAEAIMSITNQLEQINGVLVL